MAETSHTPEPPRPPEPLTGRPWWSHPAPWLVLAIGLSLSALAATLLGQRIRETTDERFQALIEQQSLQLKARLHGYVQILRGAQGLFRSSDEVTRDEWRRYSESLDLDQHFPGIQGVGYADLIPPARLAAYERAIRSQAPAQPEPLRELFARFAVHPPGDRPAYSSITYLEPFADRNLRAFGYDMLSEPVRRAAMERARDTGEPALSGRVQLMQETDTDVQPGFVIYLPVYRDYPRTVAENRDQLLGWVYGAFRAHDFMRNALAHRGLYVQYAVYDGVEVAEDRLLFRSERPGRAGPQSLSSLVLAGQVWTVVSEPGPLLNLFGNRTLAFAVAATGALISLLLAGLALAWARTRDAAQQLARRMTADLRAREIELERMSAQLRQSNEDLQQFAYAASHDLKEPLRSIAGSLGALARRIAPGLDEGTREFLAYANDGAQRLSGLIDNLLDYSRVHAYTGPPEEVDLEEALDRALADLGTLIRDTRAQVTRAPLPRVMGDREQLIRVLQNLLDNAIKYSRRHAPIPRVEITAQRDGALWVIGVTDNGIGIAPEHHDRIFVMFKRLHTRQEYEGNGMGLALCKRIVQRHGGRMWLRSHPGQGASFFFTLPAMAAGDLVQRLPDQELPLT